MGLKQTLEDEARSALKQGEQLKLDTLRMALASMRNREIEKRGKGEDEMLTQDEVMGVLRSEAKKRRDAA
ncbi:MAG: GatB/YqeY domain-containing protein, partial [Patescibacteria group bacterium]